MGRKCILRARQLGRTLLPEDALPKGWKWGFVITKVKIDSKEKGRK